MRIGVLGTGMVGRAIGSRLVSLEHEVRMGSREAPNENARAWAAAWGERASAGTFADAAFGELVFNCTAGEHSLAVLGQAGHETSPGRCSSTSRTRSTSRPGCRPRSALQHGLARRADPADRGRRAQPELRRSAGYGERARSPFPSRPRSAVERRSSRQIPASRGGCPVSYGREGE